MPPGRRRHTAAAATLPPRPHCCCHTAAAPPHPARRCHSRRCRPVEDTPTAATTPAASISAAATSAATRYPDHHRHAGTGQPHPRHSAAATGPLVTPCLPQPRPPPKPPPLTVHPSPEAAGKWPEDTSNPHVHGQHTGTRVSTRGMVHLGHCCVELPSTNPTNTVQKQYKNRPTIIQQPYNNRTKTVQKPVQQPPAKTHPPAAPNIAIQNEKPRTTRAAARRRRHPSPHCATARRGRPEAHPKGRPYRQKSDPA